MTKPKEAEVRLVKIEIIKGPEGLCVAVDDYRLCGSKPWGGGRVIAKWEVDASDFYRQEIAQKELGLSEEKITWVYEHCDIWSNGEPDLLKLRKALVSNEHLLIVVKP